MLRNFSRTEQILLAAILCAFLVVQALIWSHFTDDAYITLRYAARWMNGQGLTFNNGERVEGFSNPLWLGLIAGTSWLTHLDLVLATKLLGLTAMAGVAAAFYSIARTLALPGLFVLALGLLAGTPGVEIYASNGMEVPLLMCLLCWGLALSLRASPQSPRPALGAALCFALAAITRPEGALYAALWGCAMAIWWLRDGITKAKASLLAQMAFVTLAPFCAYLAFRLHYYGEWLPNTAIAKQPGMWGNESFFGEWAPYILVVLLLLAVTIRYRFAVTAPLKMLWFVSMAMLAATLLFSLYAGADWMAFGRFLLPVWPVVLVAALVPLGIWLQQQARRDVLVTGIIAAHASFGLLMAIPYINNAGFAPMLMRGTDQAAVGQWLHDTFPQPLTIGTARLGAVSYFASQHTFWDFLGLTDAQQARVVRTSWPDTNAERLTSENPILARSPDILLIHRPPPAAGATVYTEEELRLVLPNYRCVRQFPQGHWGSFDVWIKPYLAPATSLRCTF